MSNAGNDWRILLSAAAVLALVASVAVYWWRRRTLDPQDVERQRRARLNRVGRIVEGQVIEILEAPAPPAQASGGFRMFGKRNPPQSGRVANGGRKLICYSYSISGVSYQTAQDVTGLEGRACLERLVAGQPASVKYDPANPSNSILVADDWSGLH